jgi:acid ceramidase
MKTSIFFGVFILGTIAIVSGVYVPLPPKFADHCILDDGTDLYKPEDQDKVPWFNVDLDAEPYQRWQEISGIYKDNIKALLQVIKDLVTGFIPDALSFVDTFFAGIENNLPSPYREEIRGIADASGIPIGEIVMYNIFYEIFTVCTSIIAQDDKGHLTHARNLDFGLFLGWNSTTHEWAVSSHLRTMVVNINWIKNGKVIFKSNNFAGFIGIYNGMKKGAFSLTANDRFDAVGGYVGIIRWMIGLEPNSRWMTWLARETLEQKNSYAEALDHLRNTPMLSPTYFIVSGINPYEGAIISRTLNGTVEEQSVKMNPDSPYGWYLLQTNYDPNEEVLYIDDRRTPGNICMKKLGRSNVGFKGIYNVLSSRTNLNKLTTYTVLMDTIEGKFETHLQSCPGDCYAW